jgi:hypothetical protein
MEERGGRVDDGVDACYENFLARCSRSDHTKDRYSRTLEQFLEFCGFSRYSQLILDLSDMQKTDKFIKFLREVCDPRGLSYNTAHLCYSSIKLIEENDVLLN